MGSEARARVGLGALAFVTLLSFNQLFGVQEFTGPSLLGMIAASGIALLCRRLGLWPTTTLVASGLILVWYLVLIFQAPATFYGLPTTTAIEGLGRSINTAWGHSQIDFAPVPLRPGYAILTVAAMWIVVALGEVATFRWRRPLIASLPPVALFAFLMIVGTQQGASMNVIIFLAALFTYWALESAHRLRSWGRWVPTWKNQKVEEPASITAGLARRMGVSCVAAALVLPVFLPAIEDGLISWRSDQGGAGAFGSGSASGAASGQINPLVKLVPQLISQTEKELFRVRADEASYWRLLTLGNFDGTTWTDGSTEVTSIPSSGGVPLQVAPPNPGRTVDQQFTITGLGGSELPLAGVPLTVQVQVPEGAQEALQVDPLTADVSLQGDLQESFSYNVQGIVPDATFEELKRAPIAMVGPGSQYLEVPQLSEEVRQLAADWTKDAKTDIEKLAAIQGRLRGFDYSTEIDAPTSTDYLEEFLTETRIGYCQQFATAFALLARHLGYPTRVAVGFLPGKTDPANPDTYIVSGNETHAWPEVMFEGYGWVRFEPTPRRESVTPIYTLEEIASDPATIAGAEATSGAPGQRGQAAVRGDADPRTRNNKPIDQTGGRRRARGVDDRWQESFAKIALVLALLGLLFVALVPLLKKLRIDRRYGRATDTRGTTAAAFAEFEQEGAELATARRRSESAAAYARRIAREADLPRNAAVRLASLYEAAEFGPDEVSPEQAGEARRLARQLKAKMWAQAGWWTRVKRLWSPATLLPARSGRPPLRKLALQRATTLGR